MITVPPYLRKGDTIGIVCPSGFMPLERMHTCISTLQQWGFTVRLGTTTNSKHHYFSGTDAERLDDLQQMLNDPAIKAILCGRGGYGLSRIIDQVDFKRFRRKPKWIIGYSDITLLHTHLQSSLKIASMHSPMAGAFNDGGNTTEYVQSLRKALTGRTMRYAADAHPVNRKGKASGVLIGGNLSLLVHSIGTKSEPDTRNKILFLEDVGEYLYHIDRMMMQLKRAGKLSQLAGLIYGGFTELKDTTTPFGSDVYTLLAGAVKEYDYPVCFDFPVGHTERNYAFKCGLLHELSVTNKKVTLKELTA